MALNADKTLELLAEVDEVLASEVRGALDPRGNSQICEQLIATLERLQIAFEGRQSGLITSTVEEIREIVGFLTGCTEKESRHGIPIPCDPILFTPAFIALIENALQQQIGIVRKTNNRQFQISVSGQTFQDTPRRLFARISYTFFSVQNGYEIGRQYLVLRKRGILHEDALNQCGQRKEIDKDYLLAFERAAGRTLESMTYSDATPIKYAVGAEEKERSPVAVFASLSKRITGRQNASKGWQLAISIRNGHSPAEAKRLLEEAEEASTVNQAYLLAFEIGATKQLEEIDSSDSTQVIFMTGKTECSRSPQAIFVAVANELLQHGATALRGKQLCIHIRNGHSSAEAKRLLEEAEEASTVNQAYLLAYEEGAGKKLEQMNPLDSAPVDFKIGTIQMRRSPNALFGSVVGKILGAPAPAKGKQLCIHIRNGHSSAEAKRLLEEAEEAKIVNQAYLLAYEEGAGKKLEQMSINDSSTICFKIGEVSNQRSPNALFCAMSNQLLGVQKPAKGKQVCIYIRDGKTPDEARDLVQSGQNPTVIFLRDRLSAEEKQGLAAIASELGEAARAEYLCAQYPERFQYNHGTIMNLRSWLGQVEVYGGNPLVDVPVALLTVSNLEHLRQAFFNRMRDRHHPQFRQGLSVVVAELEQAQERAQHPMQKAFVGDLIRYFQETEAIVPPSRLRRSIRGEEEFPARHQKIAIKETTQHRSMLLADEMGGGKTGSTIATFEHLRDQGKAHRALVMCPAQIVPVWKKALSDCNGGCFESGQPPNVAYIENGAKNWEAAFEADYVVMSVEMSRGGTVVGDHSKLRDHPDNALARRLDVEPGTRVPHERLAQALQADFFALDEAHNVRNPQGDDTDRIYRISQTESILAGHLMLLTGTPIPNTIRDIASQLRLLYAGREEVEGIDITDLSALTRALRRGHPLLTRNLLVRRMLRRNTQDCLPVTTHFEREVQEADLSTVERAQYDAIVHCPFYEATEKIRLLRRLCLLSESKYSQIRAAMERALLRPKYDRSGKPPKIVIAESWFARGVTRDQDDRRGVDDADVDAFIAGRLEQDYGGMVRIFVLDGRNSSRKEQILREFDACEEPAALVTLTAVSGEGLDISCASDGILVTPTETSAKEEQLSRRMNRFGQEQDVHLQVLQLANSIEQGVAEYAVRKAELVEEYLNGRPLTAEEMQLLEDDTARVNTGGFLAYEVMSPREKVMWIISRMYGKGKDAIREFFELDGGKYARDIAQYYPLEEATSYPGNTARLLCALLEKHMPDHPVAVADIACGCRTMERMFSEKPNVAVTSLDINKAMLDVGNQLLQKGDETREEEVRTMDELPFDDNTQDFAVLSLALHYTRHNPRMRAGEAGRERINALCEMNRVLKEGGIGILTFPTNAFPDKESFDLFCAVFEQYLGFQIIHESSDFATSMDNQGSEEEPFGVWVLSIKKIGEPKIEEMDQAAWEALSFTKLRGGSRANAGTLFGQRDAEEGSGAYHEEFALGGESLRFMPTRVDEVEQRDEYQRERDRYGRLHDRLEKLLRDHHSIQEIPDEMLLSISLEEVSESTQSERDEYFRVLLEHYRDINRVPVEDISSESPVILIRNESRRGPFLCLGRIDGTTRKPCGFGRRYFYTEHISGNANRGMDTNS